MSDMQQQQQRSDEATVSFAESFVMSEAFRALFREGMTLVETTAAYLDGPGREDSRGLPRMLALAYASESMRLTTRLMQLASWLLLQRAVAEGELSVTQARGQKEKVKLSQQSPSSSDDVMDALPEQLRDLVGQSLRLQARIMHLDQLMDGVEQPPVVANPVAMQRRLLESAFGN